MTFRLEARESVGYRATWTIGQGGVPANITGWTFAMALRRQAGGSADVSLAMAGSFNPAVEGFWVVDGPTGQLAVNILPATLAAIADTTGNFKMWGDLLGTPPGGPQTFLKAIEAHVTTYGPWPA